MRNDPRERLYEMLRDAGEEGVATTELAEAGIGYIAVHIESLRFCGHVIQKLRLTSGLRPEDVWILAEDAWADEGSELLVEEDAAREGGALRERRGDSRSRASESGEGLFDPFSD